MAMDPNYLTAGSIIVALIGILYSNRQNRILFRKQHTLNSLLEISYSQEYSRSMDNIRPYLRGEKEIPNSNYDEMKSEQIHKDIKFMLNYYEYLCAASKRGDLDQNLLHDIRGGTILLLYDKLKDYIHGRRTKLGRNSLYVNLEWYHTLFAKKRSLFRRFVSALLLRPI